MSTAESGQCPALTGLALEVDGLRRAVDPLAALPARVEELAGLVTQVLAELAAEGRRTGPVAAQSWLALEAEPAAVRVVLGELIDWLHEVYLRYPDGAASLGTCWLWHPAVVEELLWLQRTWHAAYRGEGASAQLAADWHDRHRPGVVGRVNQATGLCDLSLHTHPTPRPPVPLAQAAAETIAGWWATDRDAPAPEPTAEQLAAAHRLGVPR